MSDYYLLITDAGKALEAAAHASGESVSLTDFAVGDGGGAAVTPEASQTALVNETFRDAISSLTVSPTDTAVLEAECIIPKSSGGYTIREIGILADDGTLYAVGNFAEQEKPAPDSGYAASLQIFADLVVSDTSDITLTVQDGSYLTETQADTIYLRQDKRLSEIAGQGAEAQQEARQHLGLKSAATADVQTSKDDTTAGKVLVNGAALALRSTKANATDGDVASANDLPSNSVSFVYGGATDSPGISGSLLDFSGLSGVYNIQIVASYNGGNSIKFRTHNGDSVNSWNPWYEIYHTGKKPTASDVGAVAKTGDTMTGALNVQLDGAGVHLKTRTNGQSLYLLGSDADNTNVWYIGKGSKDVDDIIFNNYKSGARYNLYHDGSASVVAGGHMSTFKIDGTFVPYSYANFDAKYQAKGSYYTTSQSDARYVTKTQLGTRGSFSVGGGTTEAPAGCVLTGGGDFGSSDGSYYYRPMQYVINGSAHTAAYTATLQSAPSHHINILESLSVDGIDELINCQLYNNTYFTDDEFEDGVSVASLLDEQGFDFYQARSLLTGTVFIAYEPDTGIIRQIDTEPQLMWPIDMSMRGLNSLPDGCSIDGTWIYVDGEVTQSPEQVRARNKRILASKLSLVAGFGVMFQLLPDDVNPDEVQALKDYINTLRSADLDSNQPAWPPIPAFIL